MTLVKKLIATTAVALAMMAAPASAANMKIAIVVKTLGNGFFDAAHKGAEEAAKEIGGIDIIYTGPTATTAEAQGFRSIIRTTLFSS